MSFPVTRFRRPDRGRALSGLCLFLAVTTGAGALAVRGTSSSGLQFAGTLSGIIADALTLQAEKNGQHTQLGIPLGSIKALAISLPEKPLEAINRDLETLLPVLSLLEADSLHALLDYLEHRAAKDEWTDVCLWAQRLEALAADDHLRRRVGLLKARSLHALGLFRLLEKELQSLAKLIPPAEAPPVYCWLRASVLARRDHLREARFWARLPFLTIPVPREPVMRELALMAARFEDQLDSTY